MNRDVVFDNRTPHNVRVFDFDGTKIVDFPSNGVARVLRPDGRVVFYAGDNYNIPVVANKPYDAGQLDGLPDKRDGVYVIASQVVAKAATAIGRDDVVYPNHLVRDASGVVIGCHGFAFAD